MTKDDKYDSTEETIRSLLEENGVYELTEAPKEPMPLFELEGLKEKQLAFLSAYFNPGPSQGKIVHSASVVGINRKTHYAWLKECEAYREVFEAMEQSQIENARLKLRNLIDAGDFQAIKFFLERRDPAFKQTSAVDVTSGGEKITRVLFVPYTTEELGQTGQTDQPQIGA